MKCGETRKKINSYYDGDLNAAEIKALENHAAECADCKKALAEARKIFDGLRQMGNIKAPSKFAEDVRCRIQERDKGWKKIFHPLPFKIPLEVAATLLIGVFIYRVMIPHHPGGKGPFLEVKESSHMKAEKSAADLRHEDSEQNLSEDRRFQKTEMDVLKKDVSLSGQRKENQKELTEKEKSEPARLDDERAFPASGISAQSESIPVKKERLSTDIPQEIAKKSDSSFEEGGARSFALNGDAASGGVAPSPIEREFSEDAVLRSQSEEHLSEPAISPLMTSGKSHEHKVESVEPVKVDFYKGSPDEKQMPEQPGVFAGANSAHVSAGRAESETKEVLSQNLELAREYKAEDNRPVVVGASFGNEKGIAAEYLAARPAVQTPASPKKAEIEKNVRDEGLAGEFSRRFVWQFSSEEVRKEMFLMIEEKGWKVEWPAVRTCQISLPLSQKNQFLEWLGAHGKLLDIEETALPENSDASQMIILDLEFEEEK